jgi:hypothetical protein
MKIPRLRWIIAAMLCLATMINHAGRRRPERFFPRSGACGYNGSSLEPRTRREPS